MQQSPREPAPEHRSPFTPGLAFELEDSRRATVLNTSRRGPGRRGMAGEPADEVSGIHHEAGVCRQL
jgi:hypothetical protein